MRRDVNLRILGTGAVSPLGWGTQALTAGSLQEKEMATLSRPERPHRVYRVPMELPEWAPLQREARLRRASGISLFLAAATRQAVTGAEARQGPIPRDRLGLIGLFHTGAVQYSRRFFQEAREQGRKFASPALFPETVYNSPLSHTAALLGTTGRVYSLVGDASAWVGALATASLWIELGAVDAVVVAASEELEPIALEAYEAAGWLDRLPGFVPSEGAAAVVVGKSNATGEGALMAIEEGRSYRTPREVARAAAEVLAGFDSDLPVAEAAEGTWLALLAQKALAERASLPLPGSSAGEAFVATAGWNLLKALSLQRELVVPFWGANFQISAVQVRG